MNTNSSNISTKTKHSNARPIIGERSGAQEAPCDFVTYAVASTEWDVCGRNAAPPVLRKPHLTLDVGPADVRETDTAVFTRLNLMRVTAGAWCCIHVFDLVRYSFDLDLKIYIYILNITERSPSIVYFCHGLYEAARHCSHRQN